MFGRRLSTPDDWQQRFILHEAKAPPGPLKDFYRTAPPASDCPITETPMVALDLETTGLDPDRDSIVSVGMITLDIDRVYCRDAHHWLYRPERNLSDTSVTIHEITHSTVRRSPRLESGFDDILKMLAGRVVVVHFAPIERRFLERAARRIHDYPLWFPVIDTMEMERRWFQSGLRGLFSRVGSLRLDACRARLNLPRYKAHHALTDALATAELLQAQVAHRYQRSDPLSRFWT